MILVYVDESGNRDPRPHSPIAGAPGAYRDFLYVVTAVTLFDGKWATFDAAINGEKRRLMEKVFRVTQERLTLADCEIKSNWIRRPDQRAKHPLLRHLTEDELNGIVSLFYRQLFRLRMHIFSVVLDKRGLGDFMDHDKIHKKTWELMLERMEIFMRERNPKHRAIMIVDDHSKEANRSLAMKHSYFQAQGTSNGTRLKHLCEMPMFVRSELSNGVQLADLCSYNIYRAFRDGDFSYRGFTEISPRIWGVHEKVTLGKPFSGL